MDTVKSMDEVHDMVARNAMALLKYGEANFELPVDFVLSAVLAASTMAVRLGMPLDSLIEGVRLAYEQQELAQVIRGGSDHVH